MSIWRMKRQWKGYRKGRKLALLPSFLIYLSLGFLAILTSEHLVSDRDYIAMNLDATLSDPTVTILWFLWTGSAVWWTNEIRLGEQKKAPLAPKALRFFVLGIAALALVAAWVKPVFTQDPSYYVSYGRQIYAYGVSPYQVNLFAFVNDPIISQVDQFWFGTTTFFGPFSLGLFTLANVIVGRDVQSIIPLITVVKFLIVPFYAAFAVAAHSVWREKRLRATLLLAVLANPVLIWYTLVDGHMDLVICLFLILTAKNIERSSPVWAAFTLSIAASTKIVGIVCLPIAFCWLLARGKGKAFKFALSFATMYGGLYLAIKGGEYSKVVAYSDDHWSNLLAAGIVPRTIDFFGWNSPWTPTISNAIFYAVVGLVCLLILKGSFRTGPYLPMAIVLFALFSTRIYFQPWYTLWFWPLLWLSFGKEKRILTSLWNWTFCLLAAFLLDWPWKIPIITLAAGFDFYSAIQETRMRPEVSQIREPNPNR